MNSRTGGGPTVDQRWRTRIRSWLYARAKSIGFLGLHVPNIAAALQSFYVRLRRLRFPGYSPPEVVGRVETANGWAAQWNLSTPADPALFKVVHPETVVTYKPPTSIDGVNDHLFELPTTDVPAAVVVEVPRGRVAGDGVVIGADNRIIMQLSKPVAPLEIEADGRLSEAHASHFAVTRPFRTPPRHLPGTTLVMSSYGGRGYAPWMFDVLPRLGLALGAGIDLAEIDWFLVNNYSAGFQVETLNVLGVDPRKVVTSFRNPHVTADRLIVPSIPREGHMVPPWVCDFLRDRFLPMASSTPFRGGPRVYVSRDKTNHWRVPNEEALMGVLERFGFVRVLLEDYGIAEKVALFDQAEIVLGPEGAGLTNIVFCRPGAAVVEMVIRGIVDLHIWDIANRVEVDFYPLFFGDPIDFQLYGAPVDPDRVVETLHLAGIDP